MTTKNIVNADIIYKQELYYDDFIRCCGIYQDFVLNLIGLINRIKESGKNKSSAEHNPRRYGTV